MRSIQKATLFFKRHHSSYAEWRSLIIYIDNERVASIDNRSEVLLLVNLGVYSLHACIDNLKSNPLILEICKVETIYFECGVNRYECWLKRVLKDQSSQTNEVGLELHPNQLEEKDREIEIHRQQTANLIELAKLIASQPINIKTMAKVENQIMTGDRHINTGGGNYIESNTGTYIQGNYISMSQDLTQAAEQIQALLKKLQDQGVSVDDAQVYVSEEMASQAKQNPNMKDKLLKWGQSLGDATVSDVVKGVVKLAIRAAGVPLP